MDILTVGVFVVSRNIFFSKGKCRWGARGLASGSPSDFLSVSLCPTNYFEKGSPW